MPRRSTTARALRLLVAFATLAAVIGISTSDASAKGSKDIEYTFRFVNGVTISGVGDDNVITLENAGGSSVDNPTGMEVHISCSDEFPGGWGEKDGPEQGVDTAWQIESYFITKDDGKKTCGTPTPPEPPAVPAIDIEKFVNGEDADAATGPELEVGSVATFTYVVTNTGTTTLTNVQVEDTIAGAIGCPTSTLVAGESMDCDSTTMVVEEGQQYMKASVTAEGDGTTPAPPVGSGKGYGYVFEFRNGVTLVGTDSSNVTTLAGAGGSSVDSPTGMDAHISCSDDFPDGWGEKDGPVESVDTAWQLASYAIVKYKDGEIDKECNDRFAPSLPQIVMDMDPVNYFGVVTSNPSIDIEKTVNGIDADSAPGPSFERGEPILVEYVVTNTGDVRLTNIVVNDLTLGRRTCESVRLEPGESMSCDAYEVPADIAAGPHFMKVNVRGRGAGETVRDSDPINFVITEELDPCISIEKTVNGIDADSAPGPVFSIGSELTFEYVVKNCGNVRVRDIMVLDLDLGFRMCPKMGLAPGAKMTCESATITLDHAGQVTMHSTVMGLVPDGKVYDVDPVNFRGGT